MRYCKAIRGDTHRLASGSDALTISHIFDDLIEVSKLKMSELALYGGPKTIEKVLKKYNPLGVEEADAAKAVVESGVLSQYIGAWHEDYLGGPKVKEFEAAICNYFDVKHAVTVNSWTSGLVAAVGAIGLEPGDEVIVTPWTMSATATAILHWNGIPVFADIDPLTYNLCPKSIEKNITPYTKAIIVADIFGLSADMDEIMALAGKHGLKVISDAAQAPGAKYKNRWAGTCGHVGGFSLNYHKHIHTGEGGILVTDDDDIAERLQLLRNHAEVVVAGMGKEDITNMIGHNFRLGEIECAIGIEQLKKLAGLVASRQQLAEKLSALLENLPGLQLPHVPGGQSHVYYVYPMTLDLDIIGSDRSMICSALEAEGVHIMKAYQNIHLLPVYQQKIAYGNSGFPWSSEFCKRNVSYDKGICPVAEKLNETSFIAIGMCIYDFTDSDIELIAQAFHKVWGSLELLNA